VTTMRDPRLSVSNVTAAGKDGRGRSISVWRWKRARLQCPPQL
jgi:hypothetical protein